MSRQLDAVSLLFLTLIYGVDGTPRDDDLNQGKSSALDDVTGD